MKHGSPLRNLAGWVLFSALGAGDPAQAREIHLEIERVTTAIARVEGLQLRLEWPDAASEGALELTAKALDAGELGYRYRDLRWHCPLRREAEERWQCEGRLRARGQGEATLSAELNAGSIQLSLKAKRGQLAIDFPREATAGVRLRGIELPLAWLQPMLAAAWSEGRFTAGTLDADLALHRMRTGGSELSGPLEFRALGLDSTDGRMAAAALDAKGRVTLGLLPDATRIDLSTQLMGGEVLLGPLYAALPESPVTFDLGMRTASESQWEIERFDWRDAGVFELNATGVLATQADDWLPQLDLQFSAADLGAAYGRYFETLFGTFGLSKLQANGKLSGRAALRDALPQNIEFEAQAVDLRDGDGRFAVEGLDGDLRWNASETSVDSGLRWRSARAHGIVLGSATLPWRSTQRRLELREAATLPLFDGAMNLTRFAWTPRGAGRGAALDLALDLRQIDLARLSTALGWPAFPGRLTGSIPGARYADEVLSLDGGLDAEVFAGRVRIGAMTLERPFGVAPTMTAAVGFERLDLQPLTAAFGFGEITGRLDGSIDALRVVDWSPVAFDADLHTSPNAKGPRRISRRAVNDLSRVGGGGFAAGLQNQVLKLFETFGYSRIGLKCRLANNICHMDGVDSSGDGYTIVEGSGLPRITVIGHQRQVDWPVLVARLKAATEGQTPIVD